jgi:hypothetical protein
MNKPIRLPASMIPDREVARECIRRHHWRRYFECIKARDKAAAAYHRALAESVQRSLREYRTVESFLGA